MSARAVPIREIKNNTRFSICYAFSDSCCAAQWGSNSAKYLCRSEACLQFHAGQNACEPALISRDGCRIAGTRLRANSRTKSCRSDYTSAHLSVRRGCPTEPPSRQSLWVPRDLSRWMAGRANRETQRLPARALSHLYLRRPSRGTLLVETVAPNLICEPDTRKSQRISGFTLVPAASAECTLNEMAFKAFNLIFESFAAW